MTSPGGSSTRKFTRHELMLVAGNVRFDRDLRVGWDIEPSIGIVAKDMMRLARGLESMREPLLRSIRDVMIPSFQRNFSERGRPKWPPLAPFTLEIKSIVGGGDKPLIRTGALRRVMGTVEVWDIGNTSATIRSLPARVWYGAIHQAGYGGMGALITLARSRLGKGASQKSVNMLAMQLLDNTLLGIERDKSRARVGKGGDIPQRQFIMFQEDDIDDIQQIFYEWLVEQTIVLGRFTK